MQPSDDAGAHEPAVNGPPTSPERLALLQASLDELATESVGEVAADLDLRSTSELIGLMNDGDTTVPAIVRAAAPQVSAAIDAIAARMRRGGRLIYAGAGSSGRIAALDASECESTFATAPGQVVALVAGGNDASALEQEAAEDDSEAGEAAIGALGVTEADAVVGVTASGRTPYVLGAVRAASAAGALTIGVVSVPDSALSSSVDHEIAIVVGPEFLAGSTRLKAGTAQKLVLNTISTITMVRLGKTYGNLMVEVVATNEKLRARVRRIVASATGAPAVEVEEALASADGNAKIAIVSLLAGIDADEAARRLAERGQSIRLALVG